MVDLNPFGDSLKRAKQRADGWCVVGRDITPLAMPEETEKENLRIIWAERFSEVRCW